MLVNPVPNPPELREMLLNQGLMFTVTFLVLCFSVLFGYGFYKIWYRQKIRGFEPKGTPYGLKNHMFFPKMRYSLTMVIPNLPIKEPLRRAIFRDFLTIMYGVFLEGIENFVVAGDVNQLSSEAFESSFSNLMVRCIQEYESKAKKAGIPVVVLERFSSWHESTINSMMAFISSVSVSPWHLDNYRRMVIILDYLIIAFHETLLDAERTLDKLNGELDTLVYNGILSSKMQKSLSEQKELKCNSK
jgi:hypothetical protein